MVVVGSYFNTSRCPQRVGVVQISFLFSVSKKQPHTRSRACYSRRNIRDLRSHGDLEALQRFVHGKLDRHKKKFTRRNNCNKSLSKPAAVLRTHTCVYIYIYVCVYVPGSWQQSRHAVSSYCCQLQQSKLLMQHAWSNGDRKPIHFFCRKSVLRST